MSDGQVVNQRGADVSGGLEDVSLDHLIKTALPTNPATDIHADSALGELMGKADMATYSRTTDSLEILSDKAGAFTGDGGADQDDSAKASLDLAHTDLDAIITSMALVPQSGGTTSWNAIALQAIQDEAEDALEGEDLDHFLKLDGATQKYPENCVTDSILAKILAKGDPAVPSTYDCTTDSLEMLSDKLGGFSGDGGAAQDDSVKASMDLAHTDLNTIIAHLVAGGDIHDVLYADAAGASIAVDIIENQTDLNTIITDVGTNQADLDVIIAHIIAGGDIHDVLYADAAGASIAVDIIANQADLNTIIAHIVAGGDIHDVLYADAAGVSIAVDIIANQADLDAILADVGNASGAQLGSLFGILGDPAITITADIGTNQDLLDGTTATPTAYRREVGVTQIFEKSITAAADVGLTTVATITDQPCEIVGIVIHADTAQTGDMTTCAVEGGVNQVVEFIGVGDAIQANLDAADKQIGWIGAVRLAAGKLIEIDLQGGAATAVDLTITVEYKACVDGGYLV